MLSRARAVRGASFMPEISTHQREGTVVRRRADPRPRGWEPSHEETVVPDCVLSVSERDRLLRLLALVSPPHRWAFEHRHMPLMCAIGILDPPDEDYARAARRRFADPSETRERALALLIELDRETRAAPNAYRRRARPRLWRSRGRIDPGVRGKRCNGNAPRAPRRPPHHRADAVLISQGSVGSGSTCGCDLSCGLRRPTWAWETRRNPTAARRTRWRSTS